MIQENPEAKVEDILKYQTHPTPYCKKIYFDTIKCGKQKSSQGSTIQWGLHPLPNQSGYLFQYVDIKQPLAKIKGQKQEYYTWQDYTEVWKVYSNNQIQYSGIDHFCVPICELKKTDRSHDLYVNEDGCIVEKKTKCAGNLTKVKGCRIYTAEAWFVPSQYNSSRIEELKEMGVTHDRTLTTCQNLICTKGRIDPQNYPIYKRKVVIKENSVCTQDITWKETPKVCTC